MTFNKSISIKALRVLSLFVATGSLLFSGISPANAWSATPLFLNFEANDPLRATALQDNTFGGATSEIIRSTNTRDGLPSDVLSLTKAGEVWSGAVLLRSATTPYRLVDSTRYLISLDFYSRDYVPTPLSIKLEAPGQSYVQKVVQASPGLNRLTFDMSTGAGWNPEVAYSTLVIFPNFDIGDGTYSGAPQIPIAFQKYEIDNVSIAGGTIDDLGTPFATANSTILTFESDDVLGKRSVGFGGANPSIEDSPAGGTGGKALRIEKGVGAESWAGIYVVQFDKATTRITTGSNPRISFNYFSPIANSPTRVEIDPYPNSLGKTVVVPKGWSQVTIDFSQVEGWSADKDYVSIVVFPDFLGSSGGVSNSYYVDNLSFNGAPSSIVRSAPPIVVNFEANDSSGYAPVDFGGNTSSVVSDPPTDRVNLPNRALKVNKSGETWAGTTLITSGPGTSLISGDRPIVKANIYSPVAGRPIMLRIDNSSFYTQSNQRDATVTSVAGWKTYTFEFPAFDQTITDLNMATIFFDWGTGQSVGSWFLDEVRFNGAEPTRGVDLTSAVFSARLADWNSSNAYDGTKSWLWKTSVAQGWIDAKTGYFAKYVEVGSTFQLSYKVINEVTGENAPDGTAVTFRLGAASSGSNARFSTGYAVVDGASRNGPTGELDQASVTTTVSGGYATITLTSEDQLQDATENPGSSTANPDELDPRFMQVRVDVEGVSIPRQDWVSLVVTKPSAAPSISNLSLKNAKSGEAFDVVGSNLGDALGQTVVLTTPATAASSERRTPVKVLNVNSNGTRMTLLSPSVSQEGRLVITNSGGTAYSALFNASSKLTAKPTLVMPVSLLREVNSSISLSGKNLGSVSAVRLGNVSASFRVTSASSIVVTVPKEVVSGSKISVTNLAGTVTSKSRVYQAPVITYMTSSARAGETIVIQGSNLDAKSIVFAGNQPAKKFLSDNGSISVVVPKGALSGRIKITTAGGVFQTQVFKVIPPSPKITSFSQIANSQGEIVVTVKGTNLLDATVAIGSVPVFVLLENTATMLQFIVPGGADCAKIIVSTIGGVTESTKTLHLD
jgi:hypothetical protein